MIASTVVLLHYGGGDVSVTGWFILLFTALCLAAM
jgi:hypothetical protein